MAAANGLGHDRALRAVTLDAAKLLGIDDEYGSSRRARRRTWCSTTATRSSTPRT